ncbi:hypothetical protein DL93DRAFT_2234669 [Clavulina sp. PMI_390]|nr:hypothetical protein DL93DRAFT_2234669 [Clavulina sp. PMI_390]
MPGKTDWGQESLADVGAASRDPDLVMTAVQVLDWDRHHSTLNIVPLRLPSRDYIAQSKIFDGFACLAAFYICKDHKKMDNASRIKAIGGAFSEDSWAIKTLYIAENGPILSEDKLPVISAHLEKSAEFIEQLIKDLHDAAEKPCAQEFLFQPQTDTNEYIKRIGERGKALYTVLAGVLDRTHETIFRRVKKRNLHLIFLQAFGLIEDVSTHPPYPELEDLVDSARIQKPDGIFTHGGKSVLAVLQDLIFLTNEEAWSSDIRGPSDNDLSTCLHYLQSWQSKLTNNDSNSDGRTFAYSLGEGNSFVDHLNELVYSLYKLKHPGEDVEPSRISFPRWIGKTAAPLVAFNNIAQLVTNQGLRAWLPSRVKCQAVKSLVKHQHSGEYDIPFSAVSQVLRENRPEDKEIDPNLVSLICRQQFDLLSARLSKRGGKATSSLEGITRIRTSAPFHSHCESVVTAALHGIRSFEYIGVSKLSCPGCHIFLEAYASLWPEERKYTRGRHGTPFPWALPDGTCYFNSEFSDEDYNNLEFAFCTKMCKVIEASWPLWIAGSPPTRSRSLSTSTVSSEHGLTQLTFKVLTRVPCDFWDATDIRSSFTV